MSPPSPSLLKATRGGGLVFSDAVLPGIPDIEWLQFLTYLPKLTAAPLALLFVLFAIISDSELSELQAVSDVLTDPAPEPALEHTMTCC